MTIAFRCLLRLALPLLLSVSALVSPAAADQWIEPKFDPPVGSKYLIQRELNVQKVLRGTMISYTLKQSALLTVEEKTADGYVMTYERQNTNYDGDPAGAARQRLIYAAMQGVVMRIATDAAGKPLRVLNFAEVRAALKDAIAALPIDTAKPESLATLRRVADRMTAVDDKQAAQLFLDDLPILTMGQDTGLQPGELHKATLPVANAMVNGITKMVTLSITQDNPATGKVRYLMTETYDPDSMKALVAETINEMAVTNVNAGTLDRAVNAAIVSTVARAQLDVAGGMTRELRRQMVSSFRGDGAASVTKEDALVTVVQTE
jgi:hypothetical protein